MLRTADGRERRADPGAWCADRVPGDDGLLDRCRGATLDVGCGPGRLTAALLGRGQPALGIDVSAVAVRLARERGAVALRRDVFGPLPGHGRWETLLLADGNLGIGGDPATLLARCRDLLAPHGRLHAELDPPGSGSWSGVATLHAGGVADPYAGGVDRGAPMRWAWVAADDLAPRAARARLAVSTTWTEAGRWFATLVHA
ncbi:methyltransferase domain-containing protein [Actinoplanes sp. LDG1-01]|uniref:Methyltransferase domain-containing protein n=1 Tax=Paractinoplanes lichenicola TaxID=2802976 RepID=A0ABS1VUK6_9ACTN|nr:methyltransferase domain-containing protein [Actinoplanes lichenicola]